MLEFGFDVRDLSGYSTKRTTIAPLKNSIQMKDLLEQYKYNAIHNFEGLRIQEINNVYWIYPTLLSENNFLLASTHTLSTNDGNKKQERFLINALSILLGHRVIPYDPEMSDYKQSCHSRATPISRKNGTSENLTYLNFRDCPDSDTMIMLENFWDKYNHIEDFSKQFEMMIIKFFDSQVPSLYYDEKVKTLVNVLELIWWLFRHISKVESQIPEEATEWANVKKIREVMCQYYGIPLLDNTDWIDVLKRHRDDLVHVNVDDYEGGDGEKIIRKPYVFCQLLIMALLLGKEYTEKDEYFFVERVVNSICGYGINIKKPYEKEKANP